LASEKTKKKKCPIGRRLKKRQVKATSTKWKRGSLAPKKRAEAYHRENLVPNYWGIGDSESETTSDEVGEVWKVQIRRKTKGSDQRKTPNRS